LKRVLDLKRPGPSWLILCGLEGIESISGLKTGKGNQKKTEEKGMRSLVVNIRGPFSVFVISSLLSGLILLGGMRAHAFAESDEGQWAVDVTEAKSRAQDFKRYQKDAARQEIERQSEAHVVSEQRIKDEEEDRKIRDEYAKVQPSIDAEEAEQEKAQQAFDVQKEKEEKQYDEERKHYVAKRDQVREVLKKEAYINEDEEYGLKWDEGAVENNPDTGDEAGD
jgi:hypothetical protein